jgi:hypothetical protein
MPLRPWSSLYGWAFALATAGCDVNIAPIKVADGCPEQALRGPSRRADAPEEQSIDDFEHEDDALPRRADRDGEWTMGWDGTGERPEASASDRCAARGRRAGHFVGNGLTGWGANWTAVLRDPTSGTALPYDGSSYGGVSFWAATSPNAPVPFSLPVGITTSDVAWNGGICSTCMDYYYGTTVSLGHAWRRFEFRFSDLAQNGSGHAPIPLRLEALVGVIFWPTGTFDVWLDDVRFER